MTIAEARTMVRQFARNAGSSVMYSDADIDRALQTVGDRFCRNTQFLKATAAVSLSDGTSTFSTSAVTDFRPERLIDCRITTIARPLAQVQYAHIHEDAVGDTSEGEPEKVAFLTQTDGKVWPTPGSNYSMVMLYWRPFTDWTAGTGDTSVTEAAVNLPNDVMRPICALGAPALLQHNQPEQAYGSESWKKYEVVEKSFRGGGNLGAKVIDRRKDFEDEGRGGRRFWLSE